MSTGSFGAELRRLRAEKEISLSALARQVHYHKGHLSKLESGKRQPSADVARHLDAALQGSGRLTRLVPAAPAGAPTVTEPAEVAPLLTRAIRISSTLAGDPAIPSHFTAMLGMLRERGRLVAPGLVLPVLLQDMRSVRLLADSAPGQHRERLLSVAAHYFEYAGWMAQELGDDQTALGFTAEAARLGVLGRAPHLTAYAHVRRAELALYRGDAARVVALAQSASRDPHATQRVRILALERAAQGHALAGDRARCDDALAAANDLVETPHDDVDPLTLGSVSTRHSTDLVRGWCDVDLGNPDEAATALSRGLGRIHPQAVRARALYGARLSVALASAGDVAGACAAVPALFTAAAQVDSATVRHQLRRLNSVLTRWSRRTEVQHVRAAIAGLVTPA